MKNGKLKLRSSVGDLILYFFTLGLWALWVAWFLHENISIIEKAVEVRRKPRLKAFDLFIILLYGGMFFIPISLLASTSSLYPALMIIFVAMTYPCMGIIWLLSRRMRQRMLLISETGKISTSIVVPIGFSYLAIILFAFTVVFGPFISLYKTTNVYNELAESYNDMNVE